jgi:3-oxoacyl-[acyl-carrier protein] reductase
VLRAFGGLDILVNSAGGSRPAPLDVDERVWHDALRLSFEAIRHLAQAFIPMMQRRRWGRIITITGANEPTHLNADQIAKAAQQAWAKGLSREIGRSGITVNSVAPGRIMSEQIERMYPTEADRDRFAAEHIPLGYFGEPEDVAYLVAFLASPRARYITGSIVYVDGGFHRYSF